MRRVPTPVARRLAGRASAASAVCAGASSRLQSTAQSPASHSPAAAGPAIHLRSRGYGPSSDLLRGIPSNASLHVEATLHPEDAAIQRAILALSMPSLAEVHVTPVRPHDSYTNRVPNTAVEAARAGGVVSMTEREVMERCLQEQLAEVANLVVEQVGQRTGQQLDAMQVTHSDELRSFAEIVLNCIQDELRSLRKEAARGSSRGHAAAAAAAPPVDAEGIAQLVSARVMERLEQDAASRSRAAAAAGSAVAPDAAVVLAGLEQRTAAYFTALQSRVEAVVSRAPAAHQAGPEVADELRAVVVDAVEKASATQQEQLARLINDWLADMQDTADRRGAETASAGGASGGGVDMKVLEEAVESAVQSATDDLRRLLTTEVKKRAKGRGKADSSEAADASSVGELVTEVERVFHLVQSTQSALTSVDEAVSDVYKEQTATRQALEALQQQLEQHLSAVRDAQAAPASPPQPENTLASAERNSEAVPTAAVDAAPAAVSADAVSVTAVEAAVQKLRDEVAAATALMTLHQDGTEQQLLTVAQVVSESVNAAVQQHTAEAVQKAMATVQQQLETLTATAAAANTEKSTAALVLQEAPAAPSPAPEAAAAAAVSREVVAAAVESVLTPRWSELALEVQRMNEANQLAMEQQLLHMANSVAAAVSATVQEQVDAALARTERAAAASAAAAAAVAAGTASPPAAAEPTAASPSPDSSGEKAREEATAAAVEAATVLAEKTTHELAVLRQELMAALQADARQSHEVDLTPMYKYIDSVLAFMKEELHTQEASLTAKMTALAEGVTAAVESRHEQQQQLAAPLPSSAPTTAAAPEPQPAAPGEASQQAEAKEEKAADAPAPSVKVELPPSLLTSLESQASALRRLEERLDAVSLGHNRDVSTLLAELRAATESFRTAASSTPTATAAATTADPLAVLETLQSSQVAWQDAMSAKMESLTESLRHRDDELLAAVRASAVGAEVKAQLEQMAAAMKEASAADRAEVKAALREIVVSGTAEQTQRTEALMARVAEMQAAMSAQAEALQLMRSGLSLAGMSAEQQEAQARLQASARERLQRIAAVLERMTGAADAEQGTATASSAAELQGELQQLRALQEEEAALQTDVGSRAARNDGDARAAVASVVQAEVAKMQEEMREGLRQAASNHSEAQRAAATSTEVLLAKLDELSSSAGAVPTIADIQQLLDASLMQLSTRQREDGVQAAQLVDAATVKSAAVVKSAVEESVAAAFTASVEQRIVPAFEHTVTATVQRQLAEHATTVRAAVGDAAALTSAAVDRMQAALRDVAAQGEQAAQRLAEQQLQSASQHHHQTTVTTTRTAGGVSLWWMLANALLVCLTVLLALYYVFACLLLAFVPMPTVEERSGAAVASAPPSDAGANAGAASAGVPESGLRRGSRYVDRYL